MALVVQVILVSISIIVVECHFNILKHLGYPSHEILHGPENQQGWNHNMFDPVYPNRQPNIMYDSGELGHGVNDCPMKQCYGPDGTIYTYDNYDNGPNYHLFNDNANGGQYNHGSDDKHETINDHLANVNGPTHEIKEQEQKSEKRDLNKPNSFEANEKKSVEDNNKHDSNTPDTRNESKNPNNASVLPDKKKLQEMVFVNPDPKSTLFNGNKYNVNTPIMNYAIPNSNLIPLSTSSISQDVPSVSNAIIVPLPNTGGVQSHPGIQIIGTDATTGLPVINVNGALYYYINPAKNQVKTQKPAQITLLPMNGPKPVLNFGTGSINTLPANPNYLIVNGNGETLQPLNNGINTNARVNIEDIISYIQQHPEQLKTNTAPNSQAIFLNPGKAGSNYNPINGAADTISTASPVVYQPTQNAGSQTNTGISTDQVANSIISFILQHPEIFASNAVSNGNVDKSNIQSLGQGGVYNNPASVVPNNAIGVTSSTSPNAYQPIQNTGLSNQANGVGTNDIQRIIAIIAQHPEIFGSNNAPNGNGNLGLNNPNNIQNPGQGGANIIPFSVVPNNAINVSGAASSNTNQPIHNTGSGNNGVNTNVEQGIITFISQHPEIFAANVVVPNGAPNSLNGSISTSNTQQNSDQGSRNFFLPREPDSVIGVSNNVQIPIGSQGSTQTNNAVAINDATNGNLIDYLTKHPEIYGPKTDANNFGTNTPIEDKNGLKKEPDSLGNNVADTNKSPGGLNGGNGNMQSYIIVQDTRNPPKNQPPNDSRSGLPLKTNFFNNDGNNDKDVDNNTPIPVLVIDNTKDLEGVRVNRKATDAKELQVKNDGAMSATMDNDDPVGERATEKITVSLVPAADTILQV